MPGPVGAVIGATVVGPDPVGVVRLQPARTVRTIMQEGQYRISIIVGPEGVGAALLFQLLRGFRKAWREPHEPGGILGFSRAPSGNTAGPPVRGPVVHRQWRVRSRVRAPLASRRECGW